MHAGWAMLGTKVHPDAAAAGGGAVLDHARPCRCCRWPAPWGSMQTALSHHIELLLLAREARSRERMLLLVLRSGGFWFWLLQQLYLYVKAGAGNDRTVFKCGA